VLLDVALAFSTTEGKHHLGAALGSPNFCEMCYVCEKVAYWVSCVQKLSVIAKIHPHVAYCTFMHKQEEPDE